MQNAEVCNTIWKCSLQGCNSIYLKMQNAWRQSAQVTAVLLLRIFYPGSRFFFGSISLSCRRVVEACKPAKYAPDISDIGSRSEVGSWKLGFRIHFQCWKELPCNWRALLWDDLFASRWLFSFYTWFLSLSVLDNAKLHWLHSSDWQEHSSLELSWVPWVEMAGKGHAGALANLMAEMWVLFKGEGVTIFLVNNNTNFTKIPKLHNE